MNKRLVELDSIRGLAAISVLFGHIVSLSSVPSILAISPLRIFWLGHGAVIFFFILSGYVLSLNFYGERPFIYRDFMIKRFFRIYIPYIVAVFGAFLLSQIIVNNDLSKLGRIDGFWADPTSFKDLLLHGLLIFDFNTNKLDTVIWSLVNEMRVSIIFPILMLVVLKINWKLCVGIGLLFSTLGVLNQIYQFNLTEGFRISHVDTLHYSSFFILGALLAKNISLLKLKFQKLTFIMKLFVLFFGLFLYCYSPSVTVRIINSRFIEFFNDWLIAGGVLIFIVIALSSNKVSIILRNKVFSFLGDISYSLYLFHFVILTALLNLLYGKINTGLIFVITISLSIIVAWISYKYVEIPSVKLGKIIVKRSKKNTELDINSKAV